MQLCKIVGAAALFCSFVFLIMCPLVHELGNGCIDHSVIHAISPKVYTKAVSHKARFASSGVMRNILHIDAGQRNTMKESILIASGPYPDAGSFLSAVKLTL